MQNDSVKIDIDHWLSENQEACIDDFMKALIDNEARWKSEHKGMLIDDHLLSYMKHMRS